jgi:hypothetical protein
MSEQRRDRTVAVAFTVLAGELLLALGIVAVLLLSGAREWDGAVLAAVAVLTPMAAFASYLARAEWRAVARVR